MKRFLALTVCLCLILCGCSGKVGDYTPTGDGLSYDEDYTGPQNTPPGEEAPQQLSLAYYVNRSLNPYLCEDYTNRVLLSLLYQSLFTVSSDYIVEPQLCKTYTVTQDLKTYTFYPERATFSDGTVLTADDVLASLNAAKESNFYKGRFLHIKEIVLSGDGGITLQLDTPCEDLPLLLDIPIVKAAEVALDRPLGTGPYVLFSAAGGESLKRRTDWWCNAKTVISA